MCVSRPTFCTTMSLDETQQLHHFICYNVVCVLQCMNSRMYAMHIKF